jgi:hypothetical protein
VTLHQHPPEAHIMVSSTTVAPDGTAGIRHLGGIAPSSLNVHSTANQRHHRNPATTTRYTHVRPIRSAVRDVIRARLTK